MGEFMDAIFQKISESLRASGIYGFNPVVTQSINWVSWVTNFSRFTCGYCAIQNGKIFHRKNPPQIKPPIHEKCKCHLKALLSVLTGTATINGQSGADNSIKFSKSLPSNYLTREMAEEKGWVSYKGNLWEVLPGWMIGGGIYKNKDGRLPSAPGRIWYEADINYAGGYRNQHRLLYSNDGLMFVTYDHYLTFYEVY